MASEKQIVRVGLIGCGEVAQTVHIPTLNNFNELFKITYLCDVSPQALKHCASKVAGDAPRLTRDAKELCSSPEIDVVFIINSTEYHVPHALLALEHGKTAFIEKPMAMNNLDAQLLLDAEAKSKGRVMVGYMRRYATAFIDAVKEIGGVEAVTYARVRDIIGKNGFFVDQSGTFPKKFTDYSTEDSQDLKARAQDLAEQGLSQDAGVPVTKETETMWSLLGSLGSHDLSVMREALGMPERVLGCHLDPTKPFWTVLFQYPGFPVLYESGIDDIPRFDAHLEVYAKNKQVIVQYDTPYVKGLPVTMTVRENVDGAYVERLVRKTYEDPYTLEYKELYALVTEGKPVKTTVQDAVNDLKIFRMIMEAGKGQFEK
ncbi:NAD(P)-binding protein [Teratosphaeria nubilosa]|uniref:NAD(P)-binding protein n=1 Tax=Teratosphaeria nubilosa TaxID=161662 RepID=A0A6G1L4P5_9PEZI|nr:NAD(P)-binding protein [Teratosphaeria nubilosa]